MAFDLRFSNVLSSPFRRVNSPANRPKWNSVSKTRSVNSFYNPKILNSNYIRRGWDLELRRKRVHMLPPLKRKRNDDEMPQLAIEAPPSNEPLTVDYNYDHSVRTHERRTSVDYPAQLSRRSSKVLAPLRAFPDVQLLSETPRSQRPVQQEWYDELSKSRSSHRADMGRIRNNSSQESNGSIQQINTPRDLFTLRSSTRNSQNSFVSGSVLDSSIRTNRATELRLSRDMEEYHQHCHDPSQSMPMEIRNFRLKGTQLTVPTNASIRPLSNVNYRVSERVKNRRIYPWNHLYPNGTPSRNTSLVPITEFRHPSFESSTIEIPQSIREE